MTSFLTATSPCAHICHTCKQLYIDKSNGENVQLLKVKTEMTETKYWHVLVFFSSMFPFSMKQENLKPRAGKTWLGLESEKLEQ